MQTAPRSAKSGTINLRVDNGRRTLIDRAAETVGKSRTDFVLEAACREATTVLLDQRYFTLEGETFERFSAELDKTPSENPRLQRLLRSKAPWE